MIAEVNMRKQRKRPVADPRGTCGRPLEPQCI